LLPEDDRPADVPGIQLPEGHDKPMDWMLMEEMSGTSPDAFSAIGIDPADSDHLE
jgi:hypothetical protein